VYVDVDGFMSFKRLSPPIDCQPACPEGDSSTHRERAALNGGVIASTMTNRQRHVATTAVAAASTSIVIPTSTKLSADGLTWSRGQPSGLEDDEIGSAQN